MSLLLTILLSPACGEEGMSSKEGETTLLEEWREILKYGIDTEVLEILKQIKERREIALNQELVEMLSESLNTEVRTAILDYFRDQEEEAARDVAIVLLSLHEELENELIIALLRYLSEIGASESIGLMMELVEHSEVGVASAAIRALGKDTYGSRRRDEIADLLLDRLQDEEFDETLKQEAILSLGSLKSEKAVDVLVELLADTTQDKVIRMYAADSLGKIGDERVIDPLKNLFSEKDALLRAYAASALANFNPDAVEDFLIQGLRDSNWKVRIASARGFYRSKSPEVIDVLIYKARKDPVEAVRIEACKALGEIGSPKGLDTLRELYREERYSIEIRMACLDVLVEKDLGRTVGTIEEVVERHLDATLFKVKILEQTARRLAHVKSPALKPVYRMFLASKNLAVKVQGIRGILHNRFSDLRGLLVQLSKDDPHPGVRKEALAALEQW
jgi:HEAT repeat protein